MQSRSEYWIQALQRCKALNPAQVAEIVRIEGYGLGIAPDESGEKYRIKGSITVPNQSYMPHRLKLNRPARLALSSPNA
jgi:hypothetical protein